MDLLFMGAIKIMIVFSRVDYKEKPPIIIDRKFYIKRSHLTIERNEELGQGGSAVLLKGSFNNDIWRSKQKNNSITGRRGQHDSLSGSS